MAEIPWHAREGVSFVTRLHEDPATRRVVDTDSTAYRVGVDAANKIISTEYAKVPLYLLEAEVLTSDLLAEDPDVREEWGMYLVLKGMIDTFHEYQTERSN